MNKVIKEINKSNLTDSYLDPESFTYQTSLTNKLDQMSSDFDQNVINEIMLWKVNRYADLSEHTLQLIYQIKRTDTKIDEKLTRDVLTSLLGTKGIRIAVASSILRFKNPNIYQIIDQRVYRIICGVNIEYPFNKQDAIDLYIKYLAKLREKCDKLSIPFQKADRILYLADKDINYDIPLKNY